MSGKKIRLARFVSPGRPSIIVPIDHGLTMGPLAGLGSTRDIARWIKSPKIDGVIAHKGMIERLAERRLLGRVGVMMHLNGMSLLAATPDTKERLTAMETAIRLGADGVSVQVNFDGSNDGRNLATLGRVVDEAARFSVPVLAMVYDKVVSDHRTQEVTRVRHLMRIGVELGIDALKIAAPSDLSDIDELVDGIGVDVPVFFAGGVSKPAELFALARCMARGAGAGLCVGRHVFQNADPRRLLRDLSAVLREAPSSRDDEASADASGTSTGRLSDRQGAAAVEPSAKGLAANV